MENFTNIKQLLNLNGKVRGVTFKTDAEYVFSKEGQKGLEKLKKEMKKICPKLNYQNIKNIDWYPLGWRIISLITIKKIFNWSDNDLYDMGHSAPSNSFIVKILLRYFISFEKTCREASKYWEKHYTTGIFETADFNPDKKYVIYRLRDFKIHPDLCTYLKGYFMAITELTNKSKNISIKETKCISKGDQYHEYIINW